MGDFGEKIGEGLRQARRARGLTLRQVAALTDGRFKATSVAGYERGERTISVERFCELCGVYGVAPQAVLGEIVRAVDERSEPRIDLTKLEAMGSPPWTNPRNFGVMRRAMRKYENAVTDPAPGASRGRCWPAGWSPRSSRSP